MLLYEFNLLFLFFLSSGVNCEINEDDCASNPCEYGECQDGINEYKCVCAPGYTGMLSHVSHHKKSDGG